MTQHKLVLGGMLIAMLAAGCGYFGTPTGADDVALEATSSGSLQPTTRTLQVSYARLHVFAGFPNNQLTNLHRITSDWDSASTTWNTFGGAFDPEVVASFLVDQSNWYEVDITGMVESWITGEQANFGILLEQPLPAPVPAMLYSKEKTGFEPFLVVCHIAPMNSVCDTLLPLADAFIDEAIPDAAIGASTVLLVGKTGVPNAEKQALIRFDLTGVLTDPGSSTVGGLVWEDADADGIRDTGEAGISKTDIRIYDCQKSLLATALTDADGFYRVENLPGGQFLVEFVAPEGYVFSPADQGSNDSIDSDADPETGLTECFSAGDAEETLIWCAGVYRPTESNSPCTHSKGYWKNRAGVGSQVDEDAVNLHLPIWLGQAGGSKSLLVENAAAAVEVLSGKDGRSASNGIAKLCAQLLAAKLNIACGTSDTDVADVIIHADEFLADHDCSSWNDLGDDDRKIVLGWMETLDDYNNGVIGPGHCDEDYRADAAE